MIHGIESDLHKPASCDKYMKWITLGCTDNGSIEPNISLCELVTYEIFLSLQNFLQTIERVKQGLDSGLVCLLCSCKPRFVDTVCNTTKQSTSGKDPGWRDNHCLRCHTPRHWARRYPSWALSDKSQAWPSQEKWAHRIRCWICGWFQSFRCSQ